jgi:hypothetical protein
MWSTTIPLTSNQKLHNFPFSLSTRQSLGLKPLDILPSVCPACKKQMENSVDHHLTCKRFSSKQAIDRHNQIVKILINHSSRAGILTELEPSNFDPNSGLLPDVKLIINDKTYFIDVSIIHPLAKSNLSSASKGPLKSFNQSSTLLALLTMQMAK